MYFISADTYIRWYRNCRKSCLSHLKTKMHDLIMGKKKFTTTLDENLIKEIKKLAIDLGRSANFLIEEGIRLVLSKYRRKASRK